MRSLKFRAWDTKKKCFMGDGEIVFSDYGDTRFECHPNSQEYIHDEVHNLEPQRGRFDLMQFTGLFDKNGNEIYENDILQFQGLDTKFQVSYYTEYGQYRMSGVMYGKSENFPIFSNLVKVVGNVYENPSE